MPGFLMGRKPKARMLRSLWVPLLGCLYLWQGKGRSGVLWRGGWHSRTWDLGRKTPKGSRVQGWEVSNMGTTSSSQIPFTPLSYHSKHNLKVILEGHSSKAWRPECPYWLGPAYQRTSVALLIWKIKGRIWRLQVSLEFWQAVDCPILNQVSVVVGWEELLQQL